MYRNRIKRLLDIFLSACGILCLSWLLLLLAVAIKLDSPGPVFFRQKRVGIGKRHFQILKFRTMRIDTPHDMPTHLLHDPEQYITRMGRFLRKTSLDELPQLWNILVGDMAVIGPRPALWNQYDLLAERDKYGANDVRPGLTGWAQIHGRDELEIAEKAKLDGWYVEHISFGLDVKCFFGTITAVLKHDGVVEGGTGTLRTEQDIENAFAKAQEREDLQIIFSVCEARRNPWFNMFKIVGDHAEMVIESQFTGRQQAPEVYDVNASIYVIRRAFLVDNPDPILWHSKFGVSVMMDTGIIDIDSEHDYLLMEAIAQHLYAHYPEFNAVRENIRG